jgi:hypothetical protein
MKTPLSNASLVTTYVPWIEHVLSDTFPITTYDILPAQQSHNPTKNQHLKLNLVLHTENNSLMQVIMKQPLQLCWALYN